MRGFTGTSPKELPFPGCLIWTGPWKVGEPHPVSWPDLTEPRPTPALHEDCLPYPSQPLLIWGSDPRL